MVKKSTLFILLCVAVLAVAVYYLQRRNDSEAKSPKDTSKPAYAVSASDITSFSITHPVQPDR
ncbi:MAG TPA: hypothetical protein VNI35_05335, partial [Nitrospira sp.]|nr:hypothetical protein [Nitrospira sp.]